MAVMKRAEIVCEETRVRSCTRRGADGESDLEPTVLKTPFVRIKRMVVRVTPGVSAIVPPQKKPL